MSAMTPAQKEWRKPAQARASQIRMGMRSYIETLGLIHIAWEQQDHLRLGYPSWEAYYNAEFSEERVQLTPEMRDKAITELRIAGMSQREIAVSTGLSASTVNRHLNRVADETDILEGDIVPPARPPIVEALTGAIEDAGKRAEDHRGPGLGDGTDARVGASVPGPEVAASGEEASSPVSSGDPRPASSPPAGRGSSHDNRMPDPDPEREKQRLAVRDRDAGRTAASRIVPDIQTAVVSIGIAVKLGEPDLITAEMVRYCREAVDLLEAIFKGEE